MQPLPNTPLKVSELSALLNQVLRSNLPVVKVVGELAQMTRASSGHWYFTLKDASSQVKAVMFRQRNVLVGFVPQVGDQVEILAQVGVYEPRGDLQLTVETLKKAGQGSLFEQFLLLKQKLEIDGLFDAALKRAIPRYVFRVGVVTSLQAAALADIRRALARRAPHIQYRVHHSLVQGEGAVPQLVSALQEADCVGYDVLIMARGGGSLEDLWAFNEEAVVRQVRACKTPIVVGVGHESDFTLAEMAADLRAATPTAAVELISQPTAALQAELDYWLERMNLIAHRALDRQMQRVDRAEMGLLSPGAYVDRLDGRAQRAWLSLSHGLHRRVELLAGVLPRHGAHMENRMQRAVQSTAHQVDYLAAQHKTRKDRAVDSAGWRLDRVAQLLEALSPQRNLEKGYAFLESDNGQVLSSVESLFPGQAIRATLADGSVQARLEGVNKRDA